MSHFDVLCIGNAIVDIIARAEDDFLRENGIIRGAMNLIDMNYITTTHILERVHPKTLVVNDPAWVRNSPEKIFVMVFPNGRRRLTHLPDGVS